MKVRAPSMTEGYDGRQVVGMDLLRRPSVLVRMTEDGRKLETARIDNYRAALRTVLARAGSRARVVVEATYGWCWAADTLAAAGAKVHLAHPLRVKAFACGRVKNDERDCADLADLLRLGRLAEARVRPRRADRRMNERARGVGMTGENLFIQDVTSPACGNHDRPGTRSMDGSSWNAVASALRGQGFTIHTPANLLRGAARAEYISSFLAQRSSGPVVLVAHSYGGFVITNAAAAAT
jgi:Transposase/Alpha/beta hydrolase family